MCKTKYIKILNSSTIIATFFFFANGLTRNDELAH